MTKSEQRIAIGRACGWRLLGGSRDPSHHSWVHDSRPGSFGMWPLPDYLNDLNACRDMEHWLEYHCTQWYGDENAGSAPEAYMAHLMDIVNDDDWLFMGATAAQRCEAFLKTLNLWTP